MLRVHDLFCYNFKPLRFADPVLEVKWYATFNEKISDRVAFGCMVGCMYLLSMLFLSVSPRF